MAPIIPTTGPKKQLTPVGPTKENTPWTPTKENTPYRPPNNYPDRSQKKFLYSKGKRGYEQGSGNSLQDMARRRLAGGR